MHLNIAEFPQPYQIPQAQGNSPVFGSLTGNISNSSPRGMSELFGSQIDPGVESDFFGAKQAVGCFEELEKEVNRLEKTALYAGGIVPTVRRLGSLPRLIEQNNGEGAVLAVGLAAAHLPLDLTQMGLAWREGKNIFSGGLGQVAQNIKNMPVREHQWVMRYVGGTPLDYLINKLGLRDKARWLENADKVLSETAFGKKIMKLFNIKYAQEANPVYVKSAFGKFSTPIRAHNIEGGYFKKVIGWSLLRTSVIGLFISSLIELPAIYKAAVYTEGSVVDKAKAVGVQTAKSASFIALSTAAIGIGGAILFPYGALASLVGMAIGSFVSLEASKGISRWVDKTFNKKECENPYAKYSIV